MKERISVLIEDWVNKLHGVKQFSVHACITLKKRTNWIIRNSLQDHAALHARKEVEIFFRRLMFKRTRPVSHGSCTL